VLPHFIGLPRPRPRHHPSSITHAPPTPSPSPTPAPKPQTQTQNEKKKIILTFPLLRGSWLVERSAPTELQESTSSSCVSAIPVHLPSPSRLHGSFRGPLVLLQTSTSFWDVTLNQTPKLNGSTASSHPLMIGSTYRRPHANCQQHFPHRGPPPPWTILPPQRLTDSTLQTTLSRARPARNDSLRGTKLLPTRVAVCDWRSILLGLLSSAVHLQIRFEGVTSCVGVSNTDVTSGHRHRQDITAHCN
jgi:hypothetical protein